MTKFGDLYASQCVPALMSFLGETTAGVYATPAGSAVECVGIITNIGKDVEADETGERLLVGREWIISTDPDSAYGGVADPETTATALIDSVLYAVHEVESVSENLARLTLVKMPLKRRSRDGFRRG